MTASAAYLRDGAVANATQLREFGFELFELLPDAILAVDRRGVIQYANHQAGRLFGQESATLVSAPVETLIPAHLRERHIAHRAKFALDPRMRPMGAGFDLIAQRADGSTFPVDIMLNPLRHLAEPLVLAVVRDITARQAAEQLLRREVNHRAKNLLSVVQAIVQRTKASSCEEHVSLLNERIRSLSASYDLLARNEWQNVPLAKLVHAQLAHFGDLLDGRIAVHGPDLTVTSRAAQVIGMALHELSTNAAKYGALSTDGGQVDIVWHLERTGAADRFMMEWSEKGGPPVVTPTHRGFGWSVLCQLTKMSLEADVILEYALTGVVWRLACPANLVCEGEAPRQPNVRQHEQPVEV
jgi:PAS domain S-box-containing protein